MPEPIVIESSFACEHCSGFSNVVLRRGGRLEDWHYRTDFAEGSIDKVLGHPIAAKLLWLGACEDALQWVMEQDTVLFSGCLEATPGRSLPANGS